MTITVVVLYSSQSDILGRLRFRNMKPSSSMDNAMVPGSASPRGEIGADGFHNTVDHTTGPGSSEDNRTTGEFSV